MLFPLAHLVQELANYPMICQSKFPAYAAATIHLNHPCQHKLVNIESGGVAEVENQRKTETVRALVEILLIC